MGPLPPRRSLRPGMTVDERMRMNGGVLPNRMTGQRMPAMAPALAAMAPRMPPGMPPLAPPMPPPPGGNPLTGAGKPPEAGSDEGAPPNLRLSEQSDRQCMNCDHYDIGDGRCELYDTHTKPVEVCDSYAKAETKMPEPEPGERPAMLGPGPTIPATGPRPRY